MTKFRGQEKTYESEKVRITNREQAVSEAM